MKIKTKLPLYTSITVLLSVTFISTFSIISYRNRTITNIENYKKEEQKKLKTTLKDFVDLSYNMIAQSYEKQSSRIQEENPNFNSANNDYGQIKMLAMYSMQITLDNLRTLRYGKNGYIWINKLKPPYEVVMHASKPNMEGRSWVFIMEGTNTNVYEAFADICEESGHGYLNYSFPKPGQIESMPKLSYVRLFEPLGWVIGTGIYIDNIEKAIREKTEKLEKQTRNLIYLTILIGFILVAFASGLLFYMGKNITSAITSINNKLLMLAKGVKTQKLEIKRYDEIGEISKSLDILIDGLASYTKFANQIGEDNFDAEFIPLSKDDDLGNSLLAMRESLKLARKKEEIRQKENKQRSWITEGISLINDIFREKEDDLQVISHKIIRTIVRYLKANQGGIFLLNDDNENDNYIELMASFAFGRNRFHKKRIELKEGVLGACFYEKKSIFMTKLPKDYIEIRSGLGSANPNSLLVTPLITENRVIGVIEIASFNILQKHEIELVEKIAENISSSLFSAKINRKTQELLEKFRIQAVEKAAQEEEMKQNLAELKLLREKIKAVKIKN